MIIISDRIAFAAVAAALSAIALLGSLKAARTYTAAHAPRIVATDSSFSIQFPPMNDAILESRSRVITARGASVAITSPSATKAI